MQHGGDVWGTESPSEWLDFSANLRPEGPPDWVDDALKKARSNIRYYPDPEMKRARRGIALFLGVPEECVLPAAGGAAAIDLALTLDSGCVYIQPPTFSEYAVRAAVHGRRCSEWTGLCIPGDTLILCNPNNPTGKAQTRPALVKLLKTVNRSGGRLVIDEAFITYCPEYSLRGEIHAGAVIIGSFSKLLCIPGIRAGYICAAPEIISQLRNRMLPWSLDAAATEIAAALPEHRNLAAADAALNEKRRAAMTAQLQRFGAEVYPSQSNFLLADFHRDMSAAAEQLKGRKILVRTCASFGLPESFWRLAVRTEEENARLMTALEGILDEG